MKVKKLIKYLSTLDQEKDIAISIEGDCFTKIEQSYFEEVKRNNGYNGYLINGHNFNYKGSEKL